mgnify:CR=1 FL=1
MKIKNLFYLQVNLLFILILSNIWDFALNRSFFNGMVIGFLMFGPTSFFWLVGNIRAVSLLTLLSIFEFMVMVVFVAEGFELGGVETTRKALFWVPYLVLAGVNCYWGLSIYSTRKGRLK